MLCWVALDRLLDLCRRGILPRERAQRWNVARDAIRRDVEAHGFHRGLGAYTQELGGDTVDASALLLSWYGFRGVGARRMRGTWRRVRERLGAGPGLLYRNEDSRGAREGAFGICAFWAADHLARGGGTLAEATAMFDAACARANDLGLFAEEVDPATGGALGNFPQAYTHVGLVNAALTLQDRATSEGAGRAA